MEFGLSDERLRTAIRLSNEAAAKDSAGHLPEAFELYKRALENWRIVCKFQHNPTLRERLYRRMDEYITRAEQLKQLLRQGSASHLQHRLLLYSSSPSKPLGCSSARVAITPISRSPASPSVNSTPAKASAADCTVITAKSDADAAEGERIKQKLARLESAKEALQEAIILPSRFPSLFTGGQKPQQRGKQNALLFNASGPPGTGKTFLAKALAAEADATILSVSAADLVSKWQGESEKLVRSLFELARERRPSIIFIDEIDSMCGARSESDSESSRRMKTEFLIQMQGINFELSEVLVLGATNTPWALDAAIRRRFERRIFIPLPKVQAREQLLRSGLGGTPHHLTDADFRHLARELEGFSGSDISVLVRDALFEPIRRCRTATAFKQVVIDGRAFYVPCHPDDCDPTTRKMTLMSVPADRLLPPEVTMDDFHSAMRNTRPSVSPEVKFRRR
ncbi:vacuolar sorting ATPase Vps4, putative [Eimeria maxima]|uniref:Vacuolar sorting ATPase Vps4, putative n=1 Tax=Eimeria maxima TaxID=5804 RepID=U6M2W7_EIMMA|nr:vacuolar sorting ATPase Vps4, putative [Eimeria maxima]CDJ58542.1 vacuolar sorting ATPase Vps4, putative [Eimeria maxima]